MKLLRAKTGSYSQALMCGVQNAAPLVPPASLLVPQSYPPKSATAACAEAQFAKPELAKVNVAEATCANAKSGHS